jgi:hypothetical protein
MKVDRDTFDVVVARTRRRALVCSSSLRIVMLAMGPLVYDQ